MRHSSLPSWLTGATADFYDPATPNLLARWHPHAAWSNERYREECEAYSKSTAAAIRPELQAFDRGGREYRGVNLASQDYLNLATHPSVLAAAGAAITMYGVHSAGSAALMGNTAESIQLEREFAQFLQVADCTVFPTGWAAAYGTIKALVRPEDHVVIDLLAHASLQEGARDATRNVHATRHCSTESVAAVLRRIRAQDPYCGILVVSETLFSMDSDVPNIADLQSLVHQYGATLLIDVAHDLGALGPGGTGELGTQLQVGKIDIVMGSFSKTFASNGGFVASNDPGLKLALRYNCGPLTFTNAISPVAARVVRESLRIVRSEEGTRLRESLLQNVNHLRTSLKGEGFELLGRPSAIVPVILGSSALARLMTKHALRLGGIVNLVEYPAVSRNTCRWRLQVMAHHSASQLERFVEVAVKARELATLELQNIAASA